MAIAIVASPAGAEGQWRGRGPTGQRLGDVNDGGCFAKEAVMNSPSKPKPSPPDDARVRDPRKRGTEQVTIRTAPEATPPRRGEDDGLRQAPSLVPSCSPSPRCCGTCDDDDASAASDLDRYGRPHIILSGFIVFVLDFELLDLVQFIHVEYCFNELFVHDDQLVYLVYPTSSSTPDTPVSTPDTKPSFTTGNLRLRIR
ncbi:hypothetical protein EDB84DRAFT_1557980 [Lactarius hengduanensis]|nr:hypothetical protein EDB84DRAFT_1557980 [Lactarius hengduanensis]